MGSACRQWVSMQGGGSVLAHAEVAHTNVQPDGMGRLLPASSCPPERTARERREVLKALGVEATPLGITWDAQVGTGLCHPQVGVWGPAGSLQLCFPIMGSAAKTGFGRQHG